VSVEDSAAVAEGNPNICYSDDQCSGVKSFDNFLLWAKWESSERIGEEREEGLSSPTRGRERARLGLLDAIF